MKRTKDLVLKPYHLKQMSGSETRKENYNDGIKFSENKF